MQSLGPDDTSVRVHHHDDFLPGIDESGHIATDTINIFSEAVFEGDALGAAWETGTDCFVPKILESIYEELVVCWVMPCTMDNAD